MGGRLARHPREDEIGALVKRARADVSERIWLVALAEDAELSKRLRAVRAGCDAFIALPASADDQVLERLHRLRDEGVGLTLDAFGRQPLELSMITRIHASTLKIDRTLTALTTRPPGTARILAGVVGLADRLGLSCIAEGIETRAQAEAAMALGLRCGQGFYFGKPVDPEEALAAFE